MVELVSEMARRTVMAMAKVRLRATALWLEASLGVEQQIQL
jgi:hypothetical protein